jgi:hypothetical protein
MLWGIGVLSFIVVASCFYGRHSAVTNRIIGAVIFLGYVAYLVDEIKVGEWFAVSRATPSVFNALLGLVIWGLPAGYVMISGHLPYNPFQGSPNPGEDDVTEACDED